MSHLFSAPSRAGKPVGGLSSRLFAAAMLASVVLFVGGWLALFAADVAYTSWDAVGQVLRAKEIRAALRLSLWTSGLSVLIGLAFAIPMGYALSRYRFPGHVVVDAIVDLPILLPPLIIGLSLLVFFRTDVGQFIENSGFKFVFQKKGIILCQFLASASFGIRAVKLTFDGIDPRLEHVALTLGYGRAGAFFWVAAVGVARHCVAGNSDLDQGFRALRAADGLRGRGADADRVGVIHAGRIIQAGTPQEILQRPRNRFVAQFVQAGNVLTGRAVSAGRGLRITCADGVEFRAARAGPAAAGHDVSFVIRPENGLMAV